MTWIKAATPDVINDDIHRPGFHFLPPRHWMNDPNGFIQYGGLYHLFYQHNPYGPLWDTMHWGHAVSDDLIHWSHRGLGLIPTPGTADEDGCWSGCAVLDDQGLPTLIYTGLSQGQQLPCMATSQDESLDSWEKYPANPLIAAPPPGLELTAFRDHTVWKDGDSWYQLIGAGLTGGGGCVLLYRSKNLREWEYLHPLLSGQGTIWECPDFFKLGDKYVLIVSVMPLEQVLYFVGNYADQKFDPLYQGVLDYGIFYAPQTILDSQNRRIMLGWLREERTEEALKTANWAGTMSLPRQLSLSSGLRLQLRPVSELDKLRDQCYHLTPPVELEALTVQEVAVVPGTMLEILGEFEASPTARFGLTLRGGPDQENTEITTLSIDLANQSMSLERNWINSNPYHFHHPYNAPLELEDHGDDKAGQTVKLHIFLDHSILEIGVNDSFSLSARIYPSAMEHLKLSVFSETGSVKVSKLVVWTLRI